MNPSCVRLPIDLLDAPNSQQQYFLRSRKMQRPRAVAESERKPRMCYDDQAKPPIPEGEKGAIKTEDLELNASDGNRFMAYLALPDQPASAQIVILPDIRGLHEFYKELAVRFAEIGYAALAIDYFGRTAGISSRAEGFDFWPHVQQMTPTTVFADIQAGLETLQVRAGQPSSFTIGFCLGGMLAFRSGMQHFPLSGVIGFYAGLSRPFGGATTLLEDASQVHVPALGLFGGADQGIPVEQVEQLDQALDQTGVVHQILIYPNAPHSFFDRRFEEYTSESADAWTRVLAFIKARSATLA
jgi:carboxymethylenebutenolidase